MSILNYKPYHIPLKQRCQIQEDEGHIKHTFLGFLNNNVCETTALQFAPSIKGEETRHSDFQTVPDIFGHGKIDVAEHNGASISYFNMV